MKRKIKYNGGQLGYLIFGNGFLGNKFRMFLGVDAALIGGRINGSDDIKCWIEKFAPDVVINCIGKTGKPNIDWCEDHKDETLFSNVIIPLLMREVCKQHKVKFVNISTGCIYKSYVGEVFDEGDHPNFFGSYYSRTKYHVEQLLSDFDGVLQLRIRMPLDGIPSDKNIISKLVKYKTIINVPNSMTYIPDFLDISKKLIEKNASGIYNVVNKGAITHSQILDKYKEVIDPTLKYKVISLDRLYNKVKAERSNCVLSVRKLEEDEGINVRSIEDAVDLAIHEYAKNL